MGNKYEIVDIMELYRKGNTIDEIAQKVYAQQKVVSQALTEANARIMVENTILEHMKKK